MLDNNFWLDIANFNNEKLGNVLSDADKRLLANQFEGSWIMAKITKRLDDRLVALSEDLYNYMLEFNDIKAKDYLEQITIACKELNIS